MCVLMPALQGFPRADTALLVIHRSSRARLHLRATRRACARGAANFNASRPQGKSTEGSRRDLPDSSSVAPS